MFANEHSDTFETSSLPVKIKLRRLRWLLLSLSIILADQLSKWFVVEHVLGSMFGEKDGVSFVQWYFQEPKIAEYAAMKVTSFFNLVIAWNTGVSFSLFNGMGNLGVYLLIAIALVITFIFAYWLTRTSHPVFGLGYSLVIGGALGNVIDRARYGAVIDYLDVHAFGYHWPAFNVADISIVTGIGLLIIVSLFFDLENKERYLGAHDE